MRRLFCFLLLFVPLLMHGAERPGKALAELMERCLSDEEVVPDSIYGWIVRLDGVSHKHPVYTAVLAKLYANRADLAQVYSRRTPSHPDSIREWSREEWYGRSQQLWHEALADLDALHREPTARWLPLVRRGKREKVFGRDMLHVVWRAMQESLPLSYRSDSLLSDERLIRYYTQQQMSDAVHRLTWERDDSLSLLTPILELHGPCDVYPGQRIPVALTMRSMREVTLTVRSRQNKKKRQHIKYVPAPHAATVQWTDTIFLNGLPSGCYTLEAEGRATARLANRPHQVECDFNVTPQMLLTATLPGGTQRLWPVDAMSGVPMDSLLVDTTGMYRGYWHFSAPSVETVRRISIFTDRAIYRPGQMVEVAGIVYKQRHWDAEVVAGISLPVVLRDARRRAVDTVWVQTDTMGVFACSFRLPENGRTGSFSVSTDNNYHTFRVEEYKRPTFYLTLSADSLAAHGVAMGYDGMPVRNARVAVSVSRLACWWWTDKDYARLCDTLYTDADGCFTYLWPEKFKDAQDAGSLHHPRLRLSANVQSPSGEVQEASVIHRLFPDPPHHVEDSWHHQPLSDTLYLFETAVAGQNVLWDTMRVVTDTLSLPHIPYEERFGDGALVTWQYVKCGKVYRHQEQILRPLPHDTLHYRWDIFRNHVRPGSTERWSLTLTRSDGTPVPASLMLTLYDASLDAIAGMSWHRPVSRFHHVPWLYVYDMGNFAPHSRYMSYVMRHWASADKMNDFSRLDERYFSPRYETGYGFMPYVRGSQHRAMSNVLLGKAAFGVSNDTDGAMLMAKATVAESSASYEYSENAEDSDLSELSGIPLRSDFSETSFFYPALRTNERGQVAVVFSLPESLTTWHLRGLAHTRTMESVVWEDTIVAQKPLMAQMQLPRFMRRGDVLEVSATVANITDGCLNGSALLEIINRSTERVTQRERVKFSLDSRRDTLYTFLLTASDTSDIICRWRAETPDASDGEQRLLHVLSDVERITVSEALTCTPEALDTMHFDHLFPQGARNCVLRKVVTDPVTSAVEALPELTLPHHADAISLAAAYYAHTLLLVMHSPKAVTYGREYCLSRLQRLQQADGSFSWFPGMESNRWVTLEVARLLRRLDRIVPESSAERLHASLLNRAESVVGKTLDEEHRKAVEDAPQLRKRLTHPDGYYLSFPGGFSTGVDQRLARNIDALELMMEVYPADTLMHRGLRRWILDQRRSTGWQNAWLTVNAVYALMADSCVAGREKWVGVMADYDMPVDSVRQSATGLSLSEDVSMPDVQRIVINASRNFDYVHLSVPRSSLAEPASQRSGYGWMDGFSFYREIHDDCTDYFIEHLPQGTYVLEERQRLVRSGDTNVGVAKIECLYAPEYRAHTDNNRLKYSKR